MPPAKPRTRVITAHVPEPMAQRVDLLAEQLERSRGWIVKEALATWIAQEERRHQLTLEALADVDAGRLIGSSAVEDWADSLSTERPKPAPDEWR